MIKAILALFLVLAQNPTGGTMQWAPLQFTTAAGVIVPGGKLCTYAVGTTTPLKTYSDYGLTIENTNPVIMGSNGRPTSNGIFLQAAVYKMVLRLPGSTTTCADGAIMWTADTVYDLAQLLTLNFATKFDDKVCHASQWPGADEGAKLAACVAALPSTGGTIDKRGLEGAQAWAACPWTGVTKVVTLDVGAATSSIAVSCVMPANVSVIFSQGGIFSPAAGQTLTINGDVSGSASTHFGGAGVVTLNRQRQLLPEWFGCVADDSTDNTTCVNKTYAAMPATGGVIKFASGVYAFSTAGGPVFATTFKPVLLSGAPAGASTLRYTATTGTFLTFNYGNDNPTSTCCQVGHGIENLNLVGAGGTNNTKAIVWGGTNGALGFRVYDFNISGFGLGLEMGDHSWRARFQHGIMRLNGRHVLLPQAATEGGQDIEFDAIDFAEATTDPPLNGIWIQGSNVATMFTNCGFGVQVHVGNSTATFAHAYFTNSLWELPATQANYVPLLVDNHAGNFVQLLNPYFFQAKVAAGQAKFIQLDGGKMTIFGAGMFTNFMMTNFMTADNAANVDFYSFNDISGNLASNVIGGASTGFVTYFPGANTANSTSNGNFTIGYPGSNTGLAVKGALGASTSVTAGVATGTQPLFITSTTPVSNLHANPLAFNAQASFAQLVGARFVLGRVTLSGGTAVVTFTGSAVFSGFVCTASVESANRSVMVQAGVPSAAQVTFTGTGTDIVQYICVGS